VAIEALAVADASHGRVFEQYRAQNLDDPDPQLLALLTQRADLLHDLSDRRFFLETRQDRGGPDDPRGQALREDIRQLRVRLGVTDTKIAAFSRNPKTAAPHSIAALLQRFEAADGTAAVEYWIGSRSSYAWVIHGRRVSWIRLAEGPEVTRSARRLHAALSGFASVPKLERLAAAEELNQRVIAPLQGALEGARQWVIVPDGPLHFVPFAALKEPGSAGKYLVERVTTAMTPALRYASIGPRRNSAPPAGRLLLVSDPVYEASDPRLAAVPPTTRQFVRAWSRLRGGGTPNDLKRLPATAREADNIRALFPQSAVDDLRGTDANRVEFLDRNLGGYRFLHVATHGIMDAEIPAMSALVLGAYDGAGRVADQEIRAGDLLATTLDADLVVLSACETSLGPSFPDEGPMGLRYAVLARGARAVVSSLWMTADELSADLMTDLYAGLLGRNERVEFALVDAMRKMLARRPGLDPALWAAYSVYVVNN
jgi:CHAT domain-containing protein